MVQKNLFILVVYLPETTEDDNIMTIETPQKPILQIAATDAIAAAVAEPDKIIFWRDGKKIGVIFNFFIFTQSFTRSTAPYVRVQQEQWKYWETITNSNNIRL